MSMRLQQAKEMIEALNSDNLDSISNIDGYAEDISNALYDRVIELENGLSKINDMRFSYDTGLLTKCLEIAGGLID